MLGSPDHFKGGVFVTKNGAAELFIQTAEERETELAVREHHEQVTAMLKLFSLAELEYQQGRYTPARELIARRLAKTK